MRTATDTTLLPLTKILLAVWAIVTLPAGLILIFYPAFATQVVWPAPLEPIPAFHAQLNGAIGVGTGAASVFALRQNHWGAAAPLLILYVAYAIAAEYVALSNIAAGPVPIQMWLYVVLGVFYLVSSYTIWRRQGRV